MSNLARPTLHTTRSVIQSCVNAFDATSWSPLRRTALGIQGAVYEPWDPRTVFQDSAGTIPAEPGDPVGLLLDKSDFGYDMLQTTSGSKPTLMVDSDGYKYLNFDGINDYMSCSYIQLGYPLTLAIATRIDADIACPAIMLQAGSNQIKAVGKNTTANQWFSIDAYTSTISAGQTLTNGIPHTIIGEFTSSRVRIYGDSKAVVQPLNTNAFPQSQTLYLGYTATGTQYFSGRIYSATILAEQLGATNRGLLKQYLALHSGAVI